jgi:hypothetical protein
VSAVFDCFFLLNFSRPGTVFIIIPYETMCPFVLLLNKSDIISVLSEWTIEKDLVKLDSSMCNRLSRIKFLGMFRENFFLNRNPTELCEQYIEQFIWQVLRGFRSKSLILDDQKIKHISNVLLNKQSEYNFEYWVHCVESIKFHGQNICNAEFGFSYSHFVRI